MPAILGADGERQEGDALRNAHNDAFLHIARRRHFRVFPQVAELFAELQRRGLKVALATSSKRKFVEATEKSSNFDVCGRADHAVTADDAKASKPAPDLILVTA